ncbi:MAG: hypothetical protein QXO32_03645 [Candidatus Bathyarchaeia archaeon]
MSRGIGACKTTSVLRVHPADTGMADPSANFYHRDSVAKSNVFILWIAVKEED